MTHQLVLAGFGGQGVLFAGKIIAYAGMISGKEVSWLPSYGPEMRGGTANCHIIVSDEPVGSPIITACDTLIALNKPSLDKFEGTVKSGGNIIVDSSLIDRKVARDDVNAIYLPATKLAYGMNAAKLANMVILGEFVRTVGILDMNVIFNAVEKNIPPGRPELEELNKKALMLAG